MIKIFLILCLFFKTYLQSSQASEHEIPIKKNIHKTQRSQDILNEGPVKKRKIDLEGKIISISLNRSEQNIIPIKSEDIISSSNSSKNSFTIQDLPKEIIIHSIIDNLDFKDLVNFSITCKQYQDFLYQFKGPLPSYVLHDNRIESYIIRFKSLEVLDLSNTKITDNTLMNLKSLTSLIIGNNTKIGNNGVKSLKNLTSLDLGHSYINDKAIILLTNLTNLNLGRSRVTDFGLKNLTQLTTLVMGRNRTVTSLAIKKLTNLKTLDIRFQYCTSDTGQFVGTVFEPRGLAFSDTICLEDLKSLPNLKTLLKDKIKLDFL